MAEELIQLYIKLRDSLRALASQDNPSFWIAASQEARAALEPYLKEDTSFLFLDKLPDWHENHSFYHIINLIFMSLRVAKHFGCSQDRLDILSLKCLTYNSEIFKKDNDFFKGLQREDKLLDDIIKVIDVFDSIVNPPPYRKFALRWSASDVLRSIVDIRSDIFNPEVVAVFLKVITAYPAGSWVELSNGLIGKVVKINPGYILRPQVEVSLDIHGHQVNPHIVDLSQDPLLYIKDTLTSQQLEALANR